MKKIELKKLIKEQIQSVLSEINKTIKVKNLISEQSTEAHSFQDLAKQFADILQPRVIQYYNNSVDDFNKKNVNKIPYDVHKGNWEVKVKPGVKWIRIDVGSSGKYMLNTETGNLHFIKGYGTPDLKKNFGNIQGIIDNKDNWWYDGYSISPLKMRGKYGFAGRIDGLDKKAGEGKLFIEDELYNASKNNRFEK